MKRNCWTCEHMRRHGGALNICESPELLRTPSIVLKWIEAVPAEAATGMPPKDADGCPGYEPKETP